MRRNFRRAACLALAGAALVLSPVTANAQELGPTSDTSTRNVQSRGGYFLTATGST